MGIPTFTALVSFTPLAPQKNHSLQKKLLRSSLSQEFQQIKEIPEILKYLLL